MAKRVIELNDDLDAKLEALAVARGVSAETIIIEAVAWYVGGTVPQPPGPRTPRQAGTAKGTIIMGPDFDEPLEDFKDYM
jgi:hypothetical protein